jgi:flagellar hook protein FlgE
MLRSLFSGISSLRAHQTMLDVTGNNIANANTTGYKASRTLFQDTLSQLLRPAGAPQGADGGTNPAQVGLGVMVAGIGPDFAAGAAQQTGRSLDMMISGDGFFVVHQNGEQLYTRAGAFSLDAEGHVVTSTGGMVQGWTAGADGSIDVNAPIGGLRLPVAYVMGASATTAVTFEGNLPADTATTTTLTRAIEVYDALGTAHTLDLVFTPDDLAVPSWTATATVDGTSTTTTLVFDPTTGALASGGTIAVTVAGASVAVDLTTVTGFAGLTTIEAQGQDGEPAGTLQAFAATSDGTLIGSFSNGLKQAVGRIALANFANPAGLEKAGSSLFRTSVNSGEAQIGEPRTGGRGILTGGALEMSNVDLSQEFTNLIIAQRGYQAGARVITTSDELLQELVNLKR